MGRRRRREDGAARALPEAIAALSRSLPAGPSPEIFRRAKFDRPEAGPALWRLLLRVLSPISADGAWTSLSLESQARNVRSALRSLGYPRPVSIQLPRGNSGGSRELLLALSWLLAREPLLERLLAQTRVHLGDQVPQCECEPLTSPSPPTPCLETEGPVDLRHVQWLMGKLRFRWRHLIASQQEHCVLLSKIHLYTRGCHSHRSLAHLSVTETEMLRDPEKGQQLLPALEGENARLQAALEWRRRELVFWQWMDTVLDACPSGGPAAGFQATVLPVIPERELADLQLVAGELQALQEELREAAEARRAAWEARAGGRGRGAAWSSTRRAVQEAVEQELAALQASWEPAPHPAQHRPHRLVRRQDGAPGPQGLHAADVARNLRAQEAHLEGVLRQLQGQCQQELAGLTAPLPGLIWILDPGH